MITNITDEKAFSEAVKHGFVLLDFHATWCGPCKTMAPALEQIAAEKGEILKVIKVDVDTLPSVAAAYRVRSVPTLVLLKDGVVQQVKTGNMSVAALREFVMPAF